MKKLMTTTLACMVFAIPFAQAAPQIGEAAPNFTATDINGETVSLTDLKGQKVVLEWTNHECPYVIKHYDTGNMQKVQKATMDQGARWITIVSSAEGKQGYVTTEQAATILEETGAQVSAKILDESGAIGKMYDAKTTPHMYVIDENGVLVYAGAIDSNPSPRHETVEGAENYVLAAVSSLASGDPVETPSTAPYGCSIKY